MNKTLLLILSVGILGWSCATQGFNPFFSEYDTTFQIPPFDQIEESHYLPAFKQGIEQHQAEIDAIIANPEAPTFENTIEALEISGALLTKVSRTFYRLNATITNDEMQAIAREMAPLRSEHRDNIILNASLFQRVKAVHEQRDELDLGTEQLTLLEETMKDFVRGGANLNEEQKAELREINQELSVLSLSFSENLLAENNVYEMVIEDEADLAGLPENLITAAAETATERGHEGKWVFTIHRPSVNPFLQYSERRDLREQIYKAYIKKGDNGTEFDNNVIVTKLASLRVRRANLMGYETHANFVLEDNMAKTPENVYELLDKLWKPALARAKAEAAEFQQMIYDEGHDFKLEAWDWRYFAEKVKKAKYDLDDELLRPYFKLDNVRQGVFETATKLFGITFTERPDIPVYHPDVLIFEVKEADGTHIGLLLTDFHPRASKRFGAWMSSFRKQSNFRDMKVTPIIYNVFNFTKPTADSPALLTYGEAETLFHEFGHALHGLLSNCTYDRLSGTAVSRDYVELCSQIMENWTGEPEVIKSYARHYQTGEPIPDELIEKIQRSRHFNQGFKTVEYLAASYLDMDWHTLTSAEAQDPAAFEQASMERIGIITEIDVRYSSQYFSHIFAGGYSSGYYSYIWAAVLDADAFEAFKEAGIFDRETAQRFRDNILSTGGTEDPMKLYLRFRGAEPKIEPLLERRGLTGQGS